MCKAFYQNEKVSVAAGSMVFYQHVLVSEGAMCKVFSSMYKFQKLLCVCSFTSMIIFSSCNV